MGHEQKKPENTCFSIVNMCQNVQVLCYCCAMRYVPQSFLSFISIWCEVSV